TVGSRRPRFGISDQRIRLWRDHVCGEAFVHPALPEWSPRFQMRIANAPFAQFTGRVRGSGFQIGRTGEARTVDIGEITDHFYDLRSLERFILDSRNGIEIDALSSLRGDRPAEYQDTASQERHRSQSSYAHHRCLFTAFPDRALGKNCITGSKLAMS